MSTTGSCIHRGCTLAPFHIGPCIIPRSIAANCTAAIPLPQAEGPATKEPEQSPSLPPGSPSGVVEALRDQDIEALAAIADADAEIARCAKGHFEGGDGFRMSIPANPRRDTDLIIGAALTKATKALVAHINASAPPLPQSPATPADAPVEGPDHG